MGDCDQILIVTSRSDTTADLLVLASNVQGLPCIRLNTEDLPDHQVSFALGDNRFSLTIRGVEHEVGARTGVCYRRPTSPTASTDDAAVQDWVADQWREFVEALEAIPAIRWLARPSSIRRAENKILQMIAAREAGFSVPGTCVTNDLRALDFFRRRVGGDIVCKAFAGGLVGTETAGRFIYTTALSDGAEPTEEALAASPVLFQERIATKRHLRLTVVGDRVFPAEVSPPEPLLDWRRGTTPPAIAAVELPPAVLERARVLVRNLGLGFSSMDLLDSGNDFYFIDLNPNGEWAWLERGAGLPIARAIINYLRSAPR